MMRALRMAIACGAKITAWGLLQAAALAPAASTAHALIVADHPDDICAPAADPCVVTDRVQVVAPGVLDFGLRTVQVTGVGRFERTADIRCGRFLSDVGTTKVAADSNNGGGDAGSLRITARRACSGDSSTPCLDDTVCVGGGLGTCSVGLGTIDSVGQLHAAGGPGGLIQLRAAGDIDLDGLLLVNSTTTGLEGGAVEIESFMGSVNLEAGIRGNAGAPGEYGEPEAAGTAEIHAAVDVNMSGPIELNGGQLSGEVTITSGRDVRIDDDITSNGGGLFYAYGGAVDVVAARHIVMAGGGSGVTRLQVNAGSRFNSTYGAPYPGSGGNAALVAGGDIEIDEDSVIESRTPLGSCDSNPYGGEIEIVAGGKARVYGDVFSAGRGSCGAGGEIRVEATDLVKVGTQSELDTVARFGGQVLLVSQGEIELDGTINVRGSPPGYLYYLYGQSGYATIEGAADVTVSGKVLAGSGEGFASDHIDIDVCRLHLLDGARLDNTFGGAGGGGSVYFRIGESMVADEGSSMRANPIVDGENVIRYRDPAKPPVLLGEAAPAASLLVDPSIPGCPVCGNSEIDQGESCDDGNTASGDGCRNDCQDEGCIADTPGFPSTALCDDGDACTKDECDDGAHQCVNTATCEEGIACTIDACVASACQHTPDAGACDDGNDCTVDSCSVSSGCTHVNTSGNACDDGDFCTQATTCATGGNCVAADLAVASVNRLKVTFGDVTGEDRLSWRTRFALTQFTSNPSLTGLRMLIQNSQDDVTVDATIPAEAFEDLGSGRFRFRDIDGSYPEALGLSSISIRSTPSKGIAKVVVKSNAMDLSESEAEPALTISMLFGSDPSVDECLTARRLTCTATASTLKCLDE